MERSWAGLLHLDMVGRRGRAHEHDRAGHRRDVPNLALPSLRDRAGRRHARCVAPGRTYLAVGTGEALNEYAATGMWPGYQERQARMAEAIELIRALWQGTPVTHAGTYYQTHKAKLYTRSSRAIPLYISALVPESAAFAGRYGDGLITVGGEKPEHYRTLLQQFEE